MTSASLVRARARKLALVIAMMSLAGCGGRGGGPPLELRATNQVEGNYLAVADCLYLQINEEMKRTSGATVTKAEFQSRNETRISAVYAGIDLWELQIAATPAGKTEIRQLGAMRPGGPEHAPGVEQKLAACRNG